MWVLGCTNVHPLILPKGLKYINLTYIDRAIILKYLGNLSRNTNFGCYVHPLIGCWLCRWIRWSESKYIAEDPVPHEYCNFISKYKSLLS
jgi:hypothetical protein